MKTNFSSEQEFIKTIAPAAQKEYKKYGYLPSVLIAQSCLENGYGIPTYWDNKEVKYLLQYNNMIGQKAELLNSSWYDKTVWPGKSFNKNTPEVYSGQQIIIRDKFRIFDNIEQSFCDFLLFLLYASNYGYNGIPKYGKEVVDIKDPETLIKQVAKRGYATSPTYPKSIIKIINQYNLTKYDDLSKIKASTLIPDSLKNDLNKDQIKTKKIIDITAENLSQIPMQRGNNPIEWIVIHYLGVPNADNPYLYDGGYGGHYNIQRDGKIYKAADPKTAIVWHCGGGLQGSGGHQYYKICTNYNSIGIETGVCYTDTSVKNPSSDSNKWYFTTETQQSLVFLVNELMNEYKIDIDHVIRHYDVTGKICPNPYVKNNKLKTSWTWDEFKSKLNGYQKNNSSTDKKQVTTTMASKTQKQTVNSIINKAVKYITNVAKNDKHGYDQVYRWNERGDFDCSSLVISAWQQAGVPVKSSGATYTGNMYDIFLKNGFKDVTKSINLNNGTGLIKGDVLLNKAKHTAIYIGNNQQCEASINELGTATGGKPGDQTGQEIKIRSYRNYPWDCVLRYTKNVINSSPTIIELQIGSTGAEVKELQTMLINCGYQCGNGGIDGIFGNDTLAALKKFQKENKLTIDGIYGQKTKTKLEKLFEKVKESASKNDYAESFDKSIARSYTTTTKLNLRTGPNLEKIVITKIPKNSQVNCYGYYTKNWYYVAYKDYVGFCMKKYLK